MDFKDIRNIQESYLGIYEPQELDEISADLALSASKEAGKRAGIISSLGGSKETAKKKREQAERLFKLQAKKRISRITREDVDIYDIILSHLLDEGYAETSEAAEKIMGHMSEEWKKDILENLI